MYLITEAVYRRKGREAIALVMSEDTIIGKAIRADGLEVQRTEKYDTFKEAEDAFFGHQMHATQLGFTLYHQQSHIEYEDEEL